MSNTIKLCSIAAAIMMTCSSAAGASNKPVDQLIQSKPPVTATAQSTSNPLSDAFELVYSCASVDARWLSRTTSSGVRAIIDTVVNDCLAEIQNYETMVRQMAPSDANVDKFMTSVWEMLGGEIKTIISKERVAILNNK